jgi:hypothetical protein
MPKKIEVSDEQLFLLLLAVDAKLKAAQEHEQKVGRGSGMSTLWTELYELLGSHYEEPEHLRR